MSAAEYWPEPLRRYVDASTGRLRFRQRMSFLAWVFHATFCAGALVGIGIAIGSKAERSSGIELFVICGGIVALMLALTLLARVEITRERGGWIIERWLGRWRRQHVQIRDVDIMTVFVESARTWPDFFESYSVSIEFPARPFSGAPAPLVLLNAFEVPKHDLAVLAKLMQDEAKATKQDEERQASGGAEPDAG